MAGYEHALFLLLLLGFLLRELQSRHKSSLYLIVGGLLLVLLPPFVSLKIPWELILALVLPWILWQSARHWLNIAWKFSVREITLWIITAIFLGLITVFTGDLPIVRGIFFGIVVTSMFWQMSSRGEISNPLEVIGPLTLVFLLVETSIPLEDPKLYFGSLFSGAGVGVALAIISITVIKKVPPKYESWILLGQVYLAYWIALALKTSPIAAVLISVIVVVEFHYTRQGGNEAIITPARLDNRLPFFILLALFIFTAWQSHQPVTLIQWFEVVLGLASGLLIALLGQRIGVTRFEYLSSNWRSALKLGIFLFGILLLWPRGSELRLVLIWIALGLAVFLPVLSAILLAALHDLNKQRDGKYMDDF
jgi:hypothetical protein